MSFDKGFNRVEHHGEWVARYQRLIEQAADAGVPNVICFAGARGGPDDETGLANCARGLKRLMKSAELEKVTLVMEPLNSKVDHKDHQCDHTAWAVQLCKRIGSERFKVLYDVYHMQVMEGDLISTITANIEYIAHFHVGGTPGRCDLDGEQEINFGPVMRAIAKTGFQGFVGQEFVPRAPDALGALRRGVEICDV